MIGKKESQFTVKTTIVDNEFVRFFTPGQNLAISFSDFKLALGVTGELSQVGDPLGAPILDKTSSTQNNIRNLEDGAGMAFSVSAQNGVVGKWNIAQDSSGVSLTSGLLNKQPVISSLSAGLGISIIKTGNEIKFTNTVDPATGLSNRVVVTQASDFSGTLDSTKQYFIDGIIDMGSQSIEVPAGGLTITGYSFDLSKLISSATG